MRHSIEGFHGRSILTTPVPPRSEPRSGRARGESRRQARAFVRAGLATVMTLVVAAAFASAAHALVVGANGGTISLRAQTVIAGGGGGAPVYGAGVVPGELLDPGGGFDSLNPAGVLAPAALVGPGAISPFPLFGASPPLATNAAFGSGAMGIQAAANPFGGGVFFAGRVADFAIDNTASVVAGNGTAILSQPIGIFIGIGGAVLSVGGFINDPLNVGAYVAAGLSGTIGGIAFDPITIRFDGVGGSADGVFFNPANAGNVNFSGFLSSVPILGFESFVGAGVSLVDADSNPANGLTTFAVGAGGILIDATLTLVADPPFSSASFIELQPLNPTILPSNAQLPNFGAIARIAEPGPAMLLAGGLILAFVARRRRA